MHLADLCRRGNRKIADTRTRFPVEVHAVCSRRNNWFAESIFRTREINSGIGVWRYLKLADVSILERRKDSRHMLIDYQPRTESMQDASMGRTPCSAVGQRDARYSSDR
jgi:hypothetical protein